MEKTVKLHDLDFGILITRNILEDRILDLGKEISSAYKTDDIPVIMGVLQGAVMFCAELVKNIDVPLEMDFVRIKSYSGLGTTGKVLMTKQWEKDVKGRKILIVEDIIDTGNSILYLKDQLLKAGAKEIKIATLLFKPKAFKFNYKIDWIGFEIGNEFVVGYGLDYDGLGRNLPEVYQLSSDKKQS
ncbi:MAG: hypoxanthine phosphoribosyltransferase [Saprospirales bacterium]|nr:MAG: hypoxanthine phosphoribosyltransferase [Saprospirales bacterium]